MTDTFGALFMQESFTGYCSLARNIVDEVILRNGISVLNPQAVRSTREMKPRRRHDKTKIFRAFHQLVAKSNINVRQINVEHYKILAEQLKIPHKKIEDVINRMQQ